jgi:hypothetical protein
MNKKKHGDKDSYDREIIYFIKSRLREIKSPLDHPETIKILKEEYNDYKYNYNFGYLCGSFDEILTRYKQLKSNK